MSRKIVGVVAGLPPLIVLLAAPGRAYPIEEVKAGLEQAVARAEGLLQSGARDAADAAYRQALMEGWLLEGTLEGLEGRTTEALADFQKAAAALDDPAARVRVAQAQIAAGDPEGAVRQLAEAHRDHPEEPELAFALAGGYLRQQDPVAAARLFAEVEAARPGARTHLLVAHAYMDFGEHAHARTELQAALEADPRLRRAHYALGLVAVAEGALGELDTAIAEFRAERELAPEDLSVRVQLGMALVEARRPSEALPELERAAAAPRPEARAVYYLGRCHLALGDGARAVAALRRARELAEDESATPAQLGMIENQLGQAYRRLGAVEDAAAHFAEAERMSALGADASRERLARYLTGGAGAESPSLASLPAGQLAPAERAELRRLVDDALARACFNRGLLRLQGGAFAEAAGFFAEAAAIAPEFPRVQYSLGVARFNAGELSQAVAPLSRAHAADPSDADVRRMLALAWLEVGGYGQAADLLAGDPERDRDPALRRAYEAAIRGRK